MLFKRGLLEAAEQELEQTLRISRFSHRQAQALLAKILLLKGDHAGLSRLWERAALNALEDGRDGDYVRASHQLLRYSAALPAELLSAAAIAAGCRTRSKPSRRQDSYPIRLGLAPSDFNPLNDAARFCGALARHSDERFSLTFYSAASLDDEEARQNNHMGLITELAECGSRVRTPAGRLNPEEIIPFLTSRIAEDAPDIIIFIDPAKSPVWSFIAAQRPAPVLAAVEYLPHETGLLFDFRFTSRAAVRCSPVPAFEFSPPLALLPLGGSDTRADLGLSPDQLLLLADGASGFDNPLCLRLLAQALERSPGTHCVILGNALPESLKSLPEIQPRITLRDPRLSDSYYNAADIFVNISHAPALRTIVLAMQAGLPIISFADDSTARPFEPSYISGFPASPEQERLLVTSAEGWNELFDRLAQESQLREAVGNANKSFASRFHPDQACARFYSLINAIWNGASEEDQGAEKPPAEAAAAPQPLFPADDSPAVSASRLLSSCGQMVYPNPIKAERTSPAEAALELLNARRDSEALTAFQVLRAEDPASCSAIFGASVACARLGDAGRAVELLNELLRINPQHLHGRALFAELAPDQAPSVPAEAPAAAAANEARSPEKPAPEKPAPQKLLDAAIQALMQGDCASAAHFLNSAEESGGRLRDLAYARGLYHVMNGELDEARYSLAAELSLYPDHHKAHELLTEVETALRMQREDKE